MPRGRPKGSIGVKGPHQRTVTKIDLVVRMELANPQLSSNEVAELCGIKINRFASLKRHPYYRRIYNQYTTGLIADLDLVVKDNFKLSRTTLDMAVPMAMQALVQQALQIKDLRVQNKAANDILAMHGKFPKVTRQQVAVVDVTAEDKDNRAVTEMLTALKSVKKDDEEETIH